MSDLSKIPSGCLISPNHTFTGHLLVPTLDGSFLKHTDYFNSDIVPVPNADCNYISYSHTGTTFKLEYPDGKGKLFDTTGFTPNSGNADLICASGDGNKVFALITNTDTTPTSYDLAVYDVASLTMSGYFNTTIDDTFTSDKIMACNNDGSLVYILPRLDGDLYTVDGTDGSILQTFVTGTNVQAIYPDNTNDKLIMGASTNLLVYDHTVNTATTISTGGDYVSYPRPTVFNNKIIFNRTGDGVFYDMSTQAVDSNIPKLSDTPGQYSYVASLEHIYVIFHNDDILTLCTPKGSDWLYHKSGYIHFGDKSKLRVLPGDANINITLSLTDNATDDNLLALVYDIATGVVKTIKHIPDGTTSLTIKTGDLSNVDVHIMVSPYPTVERLTHYRSGDIVQVLDTQYSYTCTKGGTTQAYHPVYPTVGSVNDGTAVFTVRSKITKPVTLTNLTPS